LLRSHSPLTGFEVISHWLPFLLLSPYFGALADRCDCRKLIQGSQALFVVVSLTWGILFATGALTVWDACILLILHGMAGALWSPPEQLGGGPAETRFRLGGLPVWRSSLGDLSGRVPARVLPARLPDGAAST
jgi:MFS family permease